MVEPAVEVCWSPHEALPQGWGLATAVAGNVFLLRAVDGRVMGSLEEALQLLPHSGQQDKAAMQLEELCFGLVEDYIAGLPGRSQTEGEMILPDSAVPPEQEPLNTVKSDKKENKKMFNPVKTKGKQFPCLQCGKTFRTREKLLCHKKVHEGFKPYMCNICLKSFNQDYDLEKHKRKHKPEKIKVYDCEVCPKRCFYLSKILEHMENKHPDVAPYHCTRCEQKFSRQEQQKAHEASHVVNKDVPRCLICKKSFNTKYILKRHNATFHPNQI